jgi:hypothetical protein
VAGSGWHRSTVPRCSNTINSASAQRPFCGIKLTICPGRDLSIFHRESAPSRAYLSPGARAASTAGGSGDHGCLLRGGVGRWSLRQQSRPADRRDAHVHRYRGALPEPADPLDCRASSHFRKNLWLYARGDPRGPVQRAFPVDAGGVHLDRGSRSCGRPPRRGGPRSGERTKAAREWPKERYSCTSYQT